MKKLLLSFFVAFTCCLIIVGAQEATETATATSTKPRVYTEIEKLKVENFKLKLQLSQCSLQMEQGKLMNELHIVDPKELSKIQ